MSILKATFESSARVQQTSETTLEVSMGSRLACRLMAMALGSNVPLMTRFNLETNGAATRVAATMKSDAGWYLFSTTMAEDAYHRRFAEVVSQLRSHGFGLVTAEPS